MSKVEPLRPAKTRNTRAAARIDWSAVRLAWGITLLTGGTGALITWATLTAPAGSSGGSHTSRVMDIPFQIGRRLPESATSRIAVALGVLMMLFACLTFVLGCKELFRRRA